MRNTIAVIDVGNLFKAAWSATRSPNSEFLRGAVDPDPIALNKILEEMIGADCRLVRSLWFDGTDHASSNSFHHIIAKSPRCELHLGTVRNQKQSRVDAMIIQKMAMLGFHHACDEIVLLSGDADLMAGAMLAKEFGITVNLCGISPMTNYVSRELLTEVDAFMEIPSSRVPEFLRDRVIETEQPAGSNPIYDTVVEATMRLMNPEETMELIRTGRVPTRIDRIMISHMANITGTNIIPPVEKNAVRAALLRNTLSQRTNGASIDHEQDGL